MEDEDGPLLHGEPPEGALEQIAVIHGQVFVGAGLAGDGEDPQALVPPPPTPGLGVAGVGEDAVEPRFEARRITQGGKVGPGHRQRSLNGVLSQIDVPEDPDRDRQASVADRARQGVERFRVALPCPLDQSILHPSLRSMTIGPMWSDRLVGRSTAVISSIPDGPRRRDDASRASRYAAPHSHLPTPPDRAPGASSCVGQGCILGSWVGSTYRRGQLRSMAFGRSS